MILLLDNYDSFTYNLAQYLGELGCQVEVHRNDKITVDDIVRRKPDRIVISPGPVHTQRSRHLGRTRPAPHRKISHPRCLPGPSSHRRRIRREKSSARPNSSTAKPARSTTTHKGVFRKLSDPFTATRYHSLIVERKSLPRELTITAETDDGIIMGVRHRRHKLEGVQFHPESVLTEPGKQLLQNFLSL